MRTRMNLPMGRRRWKEDHAHGAATGKCHCRCGNYFVVSRHEDEDLCEKWSLYVKNDDGGVAPLTRNGTKWVVQGCWRAAPGGGDRNGCSNKNVYGNGSCLSLLVVLFVAARVAKWEMGSRKPGRAR
jgi:hypothetical protein